MTKYYNFLIDAWDFWGFDIAHGGARDASVFWLMENELYYARKHTRRYLGDNR